MSRYERKLFFERLVAMREAYRAEVHEGLELTIEDAMAVVQRVLAAEAAAEAATAASVPTTPDAERDA